MVFQGDACPVEQGSILWRLGGENIRATFLSKIAILLEIDSKWMRVMFHNVPVGSQMLSQSKPGG